MGVGYRKVLKSIVKRAFSSKFYQNFPKGVRGNWGTFSHKY